MALDRSDVLHIAELAKLTLSEAEIEKFVHQLSEILDTAAQLDKLDTDALSPTASVLPILNVWRADVVKPSLSQDQVMANAPDTDSQKEFFKVKGVF